MRSINSVGENEVPRRYEPQANNTEEVDKKDTKGNVWEKYDRADDGEKGTIEE